MGTDSQFWDRIAARYARRPVADQESYERKLERTQAYLNADMKVLEFGCGTGSTAIAHAPFVKHILATDISQKMLEIGRERVVKAGISNISFRQSSAESLGLPDASFDVVMGHSVLHLVEDRELVIEYVYRLLNPRGIFVSSTPCLSEGFMWLKPLAPLLRCLRLIPRVHFFTEDQLLGSMTGAGFRIDSRWQPGRRKAVFVVAVKADDGT